MVSEKQRALETLARRILPSLDGTFSPSPPPAMLDAITDELLVVASDAVAAVASEVQPKPSGRALVRLLAWVVADARGATMALDKALAETVGKRLDRQAQKVRAQLACATREAEEARTRLAAVVAPSAPIGGMDPGRVAARSAEISAAEAQAYQRARSEVYIGFHELEPLLAGYVAPPRYPELLPRDPTPLPPIPPDLAAALGADACEEMRACVAAEGGHHSLDPTDSDVWWAVYLPSFVSDLRRERDAAGQRASEAEELFNITNAALQREFAAGSQDVEAIVSVRMEAERAADEAHIAWLESDGARDREQRARDREQREAAENDAERAESLAADLRQELEVVKAREEALKGVIERMIERYGQQVAQGVDRVDE